MHQIGSYYETLEGVGPGIDISHYGAPYKGMFGLDGMLYRYQAGLGVEPWTGAPAEDPRMVAQYTIVRSTYAVRNVPSAQAARAATVLVQKAQALFPGSTVRKIGSTGWLSGGRVGYEVILATATRAGEIKLKNTQAARQAAAAMGNGVGFPDGQTTIPSNSFVDAPASTPPIPETTPSSLPGQDAETGFFSQTVGGLPVWAVGLIGVGVLGVGAALLLRKPKRAAPTANRRRRRSRRRSR